MISQLHKPIEADRAREAGCPTLWGLSSSELHDAYWRGYGVQCIRRGQREQLQRGADLFLLIEPHQLVLFDLSAFADRLAWRAAAVTRLRMVTSDDEPYTEQVEVDEQGLVRKITRQYGPRNGNAYRILLTRKSRIARAWMSCPTRRDGWMRIRRIAGTTGVDNQRRPGEYFSAGVPEEESRLLARLVEVWPHPDQTIIGIEEVRPGVWSLPDASIPADVVTVEPVWLGRIMHKAVGRCLIGPLWLPDADSTAEQSSQSASLRDIKAIDPEEPAPHEQEPPAPHSLYLLAKRVFDVFISSASLIILLPIIAIVALCILLDDGKPILYGHLRQSRHGHPFRCWKFRTMYRDADRLKASLADQNICDGAQFFVHDDPRVTRLGRWLRRFHLDELPQMWNVLLGQMSLVGPRPSPDEENQFCPSWREIRLSVRPGITGLWQVSRTRRPGTDFQEWIRYDVEYVENASFLLDLKILAQTFLRLLSKDVRDASHQTR